ncbi:MAG TPA: hypothetical protein VMV07_08655 [Streptosporangiaceae bacterium]|nr:hypothetical protein [Streptosporangiaceae bacterium]
MNGDPDGDLVGVFLVEHFEAERVAGVVGAFEVDDESLLGDFDLLEFFC